MLKKALKNNAGPIKTLLRALVGYFLFLCFGFLIGWLFSSLVFGFLIVMLMLVGGPLFIFFMNRFTFAKAQKKKRALDWAQHPVLADEYLHALVWNPGPRPEFWVRQDEDTGFLYMGTPWGFWNREIVVVTSAWLKMSEAKKKSDFEKFWNCIGHLKAQESRILGVQIMLWISVVFPFSVLANGFQLAMEGVGFRELPPVLFWLRGPVMKVKRLWFGSGIDVESYWSKENTFHRNESTPARKVYESKKIRIGAQKTQLELGPWILQNPLDQHPLWPLLF